MRKNQVKILLTVHTCLECTIGHQPQNKKFEKNLKNFQKTLAKN